MRKLVRLLIGLVVLAAVATAVAAAIGMSLPEAHEATRSARIDAPRDAIYAVLVTPEDYPRWRPDVKRVELLDADMFLEEEPGDSIRFRISERQPPSRVVIVVDDDYVPFTGSWTFELTQEGRQGEATRVRITERGTIPNPLFRAMARVMMRPTDSIEQYLKNLGRRFNQDVAIEP